MELLLTSTDMIIKQGDYSLWCDRYSEDGKLVPKIHAFNMGFTGPIACIGYIVGFIGKIRFFPDGHWYLIVITKHSQISNFVESSIFHIDKVALLPLIPNAPVESFDLDLPPSVKRSDLQSIAKEFIHSNTPSLTVNNSSISIPFPIPDQDRTVKEHIRREKLEQRLCEAFLRMFTDSHFYYSFDCDLTNCLQRKFGHSPSSLYWKFLDDRFFWNKSMLDELFQYNDEVSIPWILPIIQGFYDTASCFIDFEAIPSLLTKQFPLPDENHSNFDRADRVTAFSEFEDLSFRDDISCLQNSRVFNLTLISRRSRYRAGTRYKRRGIDVNGSVANFVETELIIAIGSQMFSYVQVRGSIPIFWSQSGPMYKPLPQITQDFQTTQAAFKLHISNQLSIYQQQSIINLVDELGKEGIVKNEFEIHLHSQNSPFLKYYYFDFHKQCKGSQFSGLQLLIDQIRNQIEAYKFFWVNHCDNQEMDLLCKQQGVFRVNCMDCLDRTNVVQALIARRILDLVLMKVGYLMPDQSLPHSCLQLYRKLWADNGDAISRQYAGTAAMKGDFTRTGHRNLKGTVKDGFSSANRYYINQFKDTLRQRVIDSMQGEFCNDMQLSQHSINPEDTAYIGINGCSCLVNAVREYLDIHEDVRGWVLKESEGFRCISSEISDQVCVFLLLSFGIIVILYDVSTDHILSFEIIEFKSMEKIQFGTFSRYTFIDRKYAIRIHYRMECIPGYHYTLYSMLSKSDDSKLELTILFNELKLLTTQLNLYPIYFTGKLTNTISKSHKINNILFPSESSLHYHDELDHLKQVIKEKSLFHENNTQPVAGSNNQVKCISSSTENLLESNFENSPGCSMLDPSENQRFYDLPLDSVIEPIYFPIRKSISDHSIYSCSSLSSDNNPETFPNRRTRAESFCFTNIFRKPHQNSSTILKSFVLNEVSDHNIV